MLIKYFKQICIYEYKCFKILKHITEIWLSINLFTDCKTKEWSWYISFAKQFSSYIKFFFYMFQCFSTIESQYFHYYVV